MYVCGLSSLMRLLAIVLFHVRFTRVHDTVMNKKRERESERERNGKNNTYKFHSSYTIIECNCHKLRISINNNMLLVRCSTTVR